MALAISPTAASNPWLQILAALEKKVTHQSFEAWLKPTRYSHSVGRTLYLSVPSPECQHIVERYSDLIQEAIDSQALRFDAVSFVAVEEAPAVPLQRKDENSGPVPAHAPTAPQALSQRFREHSHLGWSTETQLNSRYTFDNFVVGNGNRFACAASIAAAELSSRACNPLFLSGGAGMGKTHLLHAICHEVIRRKSSSSVCYLSAEMFTNEMIVALRDDHMLRFRSTFRSADKLLVDDIQLVTQKERTQEELFHIFNALYESKKQIVIASDRPPSQLAGIEERLRVSFASGLIVDIQRLNTETRAAILQKKAESLSVTLPANVALLIASMVRTNVYELESALMRLIAWCRLNRVEMELASTQQCLKELVERQVDNVTIEAIQRAVARQFGIRVADLKDKNNSHNVVVPRQIAMYLAHQMTEASLPEIGRQFGNKHHTTVLYSVSKIDEQRRSDKDLDHTLDKLQQALNG